MGLLSYRFNEKKKKYELYVKVAQKAAKTEILNTRKEYIHEHNIPLSNVLYEVFKYWSDGHGYNIRTPEDEQREEDMIFYDTKNQKKRIREIMNKGNHDINSQKELREIAILYTPEDLRPRIINSKDVKFAVDKYYLKKNVNIEDYD